MRIFSITRAFPAWHRCFWTDPLHRNAKRCTAVPAGRSKWPRSTPQLRCCFRSWSSRTRRRTCCMKAEVQNVEDSAPEVRFHEGKVFEHAVQIELSSEEEEADETEWVEVYAMKTGENSRKNLPLLRLLIVMITRPAMPKPISSRLSGGSSTRRRCSRCASPSGISRTSLTIDLPFYYKLFIQDTLQGQNSLRETAA